MPPRKKKPAKKQPDTQTATLTNTKMAVALAALAISGGLAFAALPAKVNNDTKDGGKCGVNTMIVGQKCKAGFAYAKVECYDGKVFEKEGKCHSRAFWQSQAESACANRCAPPPQEEDNGGEGQEEEENEEEQLVPQQAQEEQEVAFTCTDTDPDNNVFVRGRVEARNEHSFFPAEDRCADAGDRETFGQNTDLVKVSCLEGLPPIDLQPYECEFDCLNGRCTEEPLPDLFQFRGETPTGTARIELYNGFPIVTRQQTPNTNLTNGRNELIRFQVMAQRESINLGAVSFDINPLGVDIRNLRLVDITNNVDIDVSQSPITVNRSRRIRMILNNPESIIGERPKTFALFGDVVGASSGDIISTNLSADTWYHDPLDTLAEVIREGSFQTRFIWSDRSAQGHSEETLDWTNGFNVDIPTTATILSS